MRGWQRLKWSCYQRTKRLLTPQRSRMSDEAQKLSLECRMNFKQVIQQKQAAWTHNPDILYLDQKEQRDAGEKPGFGNLNGMRKAAKVGVCLPA